MGREDKKHEENENDQGEKEYILPFFRIEALRGIQYMYLSSCHGRLPTLKI